MANASSGVSVGDLEVTPVSASIARHLGIDLSNEGQAARNRRGIAIVINGTPLSGFVTVVCGFAYCSNSVGLAVCSHILQGCDWYDGCRHCVYDFAELLLYLVVLI